TGPASWRLGGCVSRVPAHERAAGRVARAAAHPDERGDSGVGAPGAVLRGDDRAGLRMAGCGRRHPTGRDHVVRHIVGLPVGAADARRGAGGLHRERQPRRCPLAGVGARLADRVRRGGAGAPPHAHECPTVAGRRAVDSSGTGSARRARHAGQAAADAVRTQMSVPNDTAGLTAALRELAAAASRTADALEADIARAATMVRDTVRGGGTLFFCGNGGSAADAQHLAAEYVVRYQRARRACAAVALTTDTSILTAAGNDMGFEHVFARQVQALARRGDLLVIHSTSGRSPNILEAARAARDKGVTILAFTAGDGGPLRALSDHAVVVPVSRTDRAQELHLCIEHAICELVEREL